MYKLVLESPHRVWLNTVTGMSFGEIEDNVEYQRFLKWIEGGGVPDVDNVWTLPTSEKA